MPCTLLYLLCTLTCERECAAAGGESQYYSSQSASSSTARIEASSPRPATAMASAGGVPRTTAQPRTLPTGWSTASRTLATWVAARPCTGFGECRSCFGCPTPLLRCMRQRVRQQPMATRRRDRWWDSGRDFVRKGHGLGKGHSVCRGLGGGEPLPLCALPFRFVLFTVR